MASISSAQLVRVAADLDRLQEQVSPSGAEPAAGRSVAGECVMPAPPHTAAETGGASAGPLVRPRQRARPPARPPGRDRVSPLPSSDVTSRAGSTSWVGF